MQYYHAYLWSSGSVPIYDDKVDSKAHLQNMTQLNTLKENTEIKQYLHPRLLGNFSGGIILVIKQLLRYLLSNFSFHCINLDSLLKTNC